MSRILIVGGDMRNVCLAKILCSEGYDVGVCAIDKKFFKDHDICMHSSLKDAASQAELVLLPVVCSSDNIVINTPLHDDCFYLGDIYENVSAATIVCGGKMNLSEFEKRGLLAIDYAKRDDFAALNAVPTAEGAIEAVMKHLPVTIFSSNAVVTGFGKCAKVLAMLLKSMGAGVTVCARKQGDLALAEALGLKSTKITSMHNALSRADMVFNTVPDIVFGTAEFFAMKKGCILADLASAPGGADKNALCNADIKYMFLPGLPGKYSPVSAARIIWKIAINIIGECGKDASTWNLRERG
ncbi:MAG: hypothetical protein IJB70_05490 [Clostridia bacterium]|nr:hypothetical protein [Clostridia bacterium]